MMLFEEESQRALEAAAEKKRKRDQGRGDREKLKQQKQQEKEGRGKLKQQRQQKQQQEEHREELKQRKQQQKQPAGTEHCWHCWADVAVADYNYNTERCGDEAACGLR